MVIMSVDLGDVRTGIAYSDNKAVFALPKCVISERKRDVLIKRICEVASEIKPDRIVVGLPKNMDGSLGFRAEECTETAKQIESACNIQTVLWDERCTTVIAHNRLNDTNTKGKKRKAVVDAVAATVILESYLSFIKNNGNEV